MRDLIRQLREDWGRHKASASVRSMPALVNYRVGRWVKEQPLPVRWAGGKVYGVGLLVAEMMSGIHLDRDTQVGEGFHMIHAGGINIHPDTVIGDRVGIMHGVTLATGPGGRPAVIGDDVFIGANACVLGAEVGAGARVAANSLVLNDVPPGAMAIGVPAKNVPQLGAKGAKKAKPAAADST
ncbi:MAG: serine O-acetyltransferase [Sandaracinaceae bacterium]